MRPSSVCMPVAMTSAAAVPVATDVPMNTASCRSASGAPSGAGVASLLDRRALAGQRRLIGRERVRRQAGARRPRQCRRPRARGRRRAPPCWPGPSRSGRRAARGHVARSSSGGPCTARSARCSWRKPTSALRTTIAPIATASRNSANSAEMMAAPRRSQMTGLENCRASSVSGDVACSRRISFGPNSSSRWAASAADSPSGVLACTGPDDTRVVTVPPSALPERADGVMTVHPSACRRWASGGRPAAARPADQPGRPRRRPTRLPGLLQPQWLPQLATL